MPTPRPTAEQAALAELRAPTCATTTQFFAAHVLESTDGEPHVHGVLLDGDVHQVHFRPQDEDYFLVFMVSATPDGWDILGARASAKSFHRRGNSDQHEGPGGRGLKFPGLMGLDAK